MGAGGQLAGRPPIPRHAALTEAVRDDSGGIKAAFIKHATEDLGLGTQEEPEE